MNNFALQLEQSSQWQTKNWSTQQSYTFTGKCVNILDNTSNPSQRLEELEELIHHIQSQLDSDENETLKLGMHDTNGLLFFTSKNNMQKSLASIVVTRSIIELLQLYAGVKIIFIECNHVDETVKIDINRGDPLFSTLQHEWNDIIQGRAHNRTQTLKTVPIIYMARYIRVVPHYQLLKWTTNSKMGYLFENDFLQSSSGVREHEITISSRDGINKRRLT